MAKRSRMDANLTVLVLGRGPADASLVEQALTGAGYTVIRTEHPHTAVRLAKYGEADLLVVDLELEALGVIPRWQRRRTDPDPVEAALPDTHGYALLRALESDPSAARHTAVFLRGAGASNEYRFGVVGYVPKPVEPQALRQKVQRLPRPRPPAKAGDGEHAKAVPAEAERLEELSPEGDSEAGWDVPAPLFEALPKTLRTALVLEPVPADRGLVHHLLEPHGFTVFDAEDKDEALRIALEKRPWLILTDTLMPKGDGFDFCRAVRSHSLLSHTPLVFLSRWDGARERYHAFKLGADDYLSKRASAAEMLIRCDLILKRYSDLRTRAHRGAGLEGGIELIGVPSILQICHLSQLSGVLAARRGPELVEVRFRGGEVLSARTSRAQGAEAVQQFLSWTSGHFEFVTRDPGEGPGLGQPFEKLLLEGCRLLDESNESQRRDSPQDEVPPL